MRRVANRTSRKPAFSAAKNTKIFQPIYQDRKIRLYFNKNPKNLKLSAPQKKRVFREKEKTVKTSLVRLLVALGLLVVYGSSSVMAEGPLPSCRPPVVCSVR
jgi:hypothetical protein